MADQDFNINIRVNANTAQVDAIRNSFEKLGAQVQVTNAQAAAGGGALGQLGSTFGVSAIGVGVALNQAIKAYGDEQVRIAEEAAKHLNLLIQSAKKWDEMARAATSMEDVLKLAETATKSVADAQEEFLTFQNKGLAGWKEWIDALTTIPGITSGVFGKLFKDEANRLADHAAKVRQARDVAVEEGRAVTEAFDEEKLKPFDEAFADINAKLVEHERLQAQTFDTDVYIKEGKQIEIYKAQIKELIQLERERKKETDEAKDSAQDDADVRAIGQKRIAAAADKLKAAKAKADPYDLTAGGDPYDLTTGGDPYAQKDEVKDAQNELNQEMVNALKNNTQAVKENTGLWK